MFTQACVKLYKKAGLQFMPLSASSQISSSEGLHGQSRHISVTRNHEAVMVKEPDPPPEYGKQRRPGKNFQNTIANIHHAPSFIGEDATIRLIGLSQRSS